MRRLATARSLTLLMLLAGISDAAAQQSQTPPAQPPSNPAPRSSAPTQTPAAPTQPPASQPAAPSPAPGGPAQSAPNPAAAGALAFTSDAGLVLFTVKAEAAPDFEAFLAKVKDALDKGSKPEFKQMAVGWKVYKVAEAAQSGQVMYACVIDPVVRGGDYDPLKILSDVAPADAVAMYPKLKDAIVSVNRLNLSGALRMGQ